MILEIIRMVRNMVNGNHGKDGTQWNEENYVDGKKHGKFLTWRSGEVKEFRRSI